MYNELYFRLVANTPIGTNCGFEEYAKFEAIVLLLLIIINKKKFILLLE